MTTRNLASQAVELLEDVVIQEGLSANAVAAKCGVEQSTVSRILNRQRTPSFDTYEKILSGLGYVARIEIEPK